jgi:hypothetical protein
MLSSKLAISVVNLFNNFEDIYKDASITEDEV